MKGMPRSSLRTLRRRLYRVPSSTYNHASARNLERFGELTAAKAQPAAILNVGGGGRGLPDAITRAAGPGGVVNIDITRDPAVTCRADALRLPFASGSFDGVLSTAVLEHLPTPQTAIDEMGRVARPGALLYIEAPFLQGYHASPDDYHRFTSSGLRHAFRAHHDVEVGVCAGPSSALTWILRGYLKGLLSGFSRRRRLELLADFVAGWLTAPVKFLDRLVAERPAAEDFASAFYVLARAGAAEAESPTPINETRE